MDEVIAVTARQVPPLERLGYRAEPDRGGATTACSSGTWRESSRSPRAGAGEGDFAVLCVASLRPEKGVGRLRRGDRRRPASRCRGCAAAGRRGPRARARSRRAAAGAKGVTAARLARRRARPARGRRRGLPAQRGRGAADEHPRGDGAGPAGGRHRRGRHRRARARTARPGTSCRPATAARSRARWSSWPRTRPEWSEMGARRPPAPARALHGRAMVEGYRAAFEGAVARGQADVLLVSLGTTLGWRRGRPVLLRPARARGASTEAVSVGRGAADRLRRGYPRERPRRDGRRPARRARGASSAWSRAR